MIIQMSWLGKDHIGRFGNQLFAFFFLKVVESELGCEIRYPAWLGNILFDFPESWPLLAPDEVIGFERELEYEGVNFKQQASRENGPRAEISVIADCLARNVKTLELLGFFQYHTSTYVRKRDLFLDVFALNEKIEQQIDKSLERLGLADRPVICVHVRRGDYLLHGNGHALFWGSSFDAIARALLDITLSAFRNFIVYLCSDDIEHCRSEFETRGIPCLTGSNLFSGLDNPGGLMVDFMMMVKSDALVISNSSLSFAAAMLNRKARVFLRPCPVQDRLIPFDPWNSHVLLPKHPFQLN